MTIATTTNTAEVLAGMFTENTGSHFLDSGGAYGRHHEQNAGKTAQDFLAAPRVYVEDDYAVLDTYHFLNDRVEFSPAMTAAFDRWLESDPDLTEWDGMNDWPDAIGAESNGIVNTYNGECNLSQTLQFVTFTLGGSAWVLLQVHGGADVRGGYTAPKVFALDDWVDLYDYDRLRLNCGDCDAYTDYEQDRPDYSEHGSECREGCGATDNKIPDANGPEFGHAWSLKDGCPCCGSDALQ